MICCSKNSQFNCNEGEIEKKNSLMEMKTRDRGKKKESEKNKKALMNV